MIVEIGETLINTDNICVCFKSKYDLKLIFIGGFEYNFSWANQTDPEVAYQTLKLVETVINKK